MPLQILLTGFGPFGNVVDNPTERLLRHFEGQTHSGLELTTCALPTSFGRGPQTFKAALEAGGRDGQPFDIVLMLGVAAGSYAWRVETQGLNWDDPRIPDIDGFSTPGRTIVEGSLAQLPATLSPSLLAQAIETVGVPVILSNSAGAYLCNHLLYVALHHVQASGHPAQVGFLHIPADEHTYAPPDEDATTTTSSGSVFPFTQHVDVIRATLSYVAQYGGRKKEKGNSSIVIPFSFFLSSEIALTFNLHSYMERKRQDVESALDRYLPPTTARPETLHDSLRYSVLAPGKRLRPILVLASAEAVGGSAQDVMPTACALECIHAFSLIHDDLPCMDNDDYRRGRLTNHKVYGEAMALLAGDALLALAFQMIADNGKLVIAERIIPVLHLVAEASGTWGMVGGQVVDMQSQGQEVTSDTLRYIHGHKTGALLTASVLSGAMLAGGSSQELESLRSYGGHIGLAFQIADDILDVTGDESKIGKPVGSDQERDKATYPRLYGLDESKRRAHEEVEAALATLRDFSTDADPLRAIARYIVERDL